MHIAANNLRPDQHHPQSASTKQTATPRAAARPPTPPGLRLVTRCARGNTMAKATTTPGSRRDDGDHGSAAAAAAAAPRSEEEHGLLAGHAEDEEADGDDGRALTLDTGVQANGDQKTVHVSAMFKGATGNGTPRTPRTPNRVRFDLQPTNIPHPANGRGQRASMSDDGDDIELAAHDPLHSYGDDDYDDDHGRDTQRLPLLTDIEAPSVALANTPWGSDDDVHEWAEAERARPKSGLRSAFMNMANSIIGAGIIGQPYAFKQAGLLAGVVLLVVLTIIVDWTIRLIVVNSKLSGANSFQGTVEHCFGRTGLIAISIAQWAFAFGGMIAFGIIVGDSIPHVLQAVWPGLSDIPVLGLLSDRRVVIAVFTMGVSYPLSLYRDIAKVSRGLPGSPMGGTEARRRVANRIWGNSWRRRAHLRWSAWRLSWSRLWCREHSCPRRSGAPLPRPYSQLTPESLRPLVLSRLVRVHAPAGGAGLASKYSF